MRKEDKEETLHVLQILKEHPWAWRVNEKEDAHRDPYWWHSVLTNDSSLSEWSFVAPRSPGVMRESSAKRMGAQRSGINNPGCKNKIVYYEEDTIKEKAKILYYSGLEIGKIKKVLNQEFPNYSYMFADIKTYDFGRGHNKKNYILAHLLDMEVNEVINECSTRRGKSISRGQKNSEKFLEFASAHAAKLFSDIRVSKTQIRLFEMVKRCDPEATLEHKIVDPITKKVKCFDVFSPKISSCLEMHGRVWHDIHKTRSNLVDLVKKNVANDVFKQSLAIQHGLKYIVFWDDEEDNWPNQLRDLYDCEKN